MKKEKKPIIFLADQIDPDGIKILLKKFELINSAGRSNLHLINILKKYSQTDLRPSALVIRSTRKIKKAFTRELARIGGIRLICTVSAGFDNVDTRECRKYGIDVMNAGGANSISAAEFTMALILNAYKSIIPASHSMKKGKFNFSVYSNHELYGKTLGIVGVGKVGSKVAALAKAFNMNVVGNDIDPSVKKKYPFIKFVPLKALLKTSDVVTLHTPLDESTRNLINSENLKLVRKNSLLINTARGGIINEKAVKAWLRRNDAVYLAADVFEKEPDFDKELSLFRNVILTPHLAGKTSESRKRMSVLAAENILKYFSKNRSSLKFVN